jgi:hypothetical protein
VTNVDTARIWHTPDMDRLTFTMVARIPPDGIAEFQRYESEVLPALAAHGGRLERRLRTADELTEVHVVSFASQAAFEAYRADTRCVAARPRLARSGAEVELLVVHDVADPG